MSRYYRISDPSDVRDLDEQMAAWVAAGNPKADDWAVQPESPSQDAMWQDGQWVTPPAPAYTASQWVELQGFAGNRTTTLLYLKMNLDSTNKTSPKLAAVQAWLDQLIIAGVTSPEDRRSDFLPCPYTFQEVSTEAISVLNS